MVCGVRWFSSVGGSPRTVRRGWSRTRSARAPAPSSGAPSRRRWGQAASSRGGGASPVRGVRVPGTAPRQRALTDAIALVEQTTLRVPTPCPGNGTNPARRDTHHDVTPITTRNRVPRTRPSRTLTLRSRPLPDRVDEDHRPDRARRPARPSGESPDDLLADPTDRVLGHLRPTGLVEAHGAPRSSNPARSTAARSDRPRRDGACTRARPPGRPARHDHEAPRSRPARSRRAPPSSGPRRACPHRPGRHRARARPARSAQHSARSRARPT